MSETTARQAEPAAARLLLQRMGIEVADLLSAPAPDPVVPTFAAYVPVVVAAASPGSRKAYGTYWNRLVEHWGDRRLHEPTPTEMEQFKGPYPGGGAEPAQRPGRPVGGRAHGGGAAVCVSAGGGRRPDPRAAALPSLRGAVADARWQRSTRWRRRPATIRRWTACCCGCTPRPPG
jgi:hypothetical protein